MKVQTVNYLAQDAGKHFVESLRSTGFAVIANHPIPAELISNVYREWSNFFSSETKHRYLFNSEKQAGYFPFKSENAKDSTKKDLKEFFHHYPWAEFPSGTNEFSPKLYQLMVNLSLELLDWIDSNLPKEIKIRFSMPLTQMVKDSPEQLLRVIHYPPLSGAEEEGAVRAAAHEDINLITLLPAATQPGLQVLDLEGRWHTVECDPGTLIINSGDMLKEASGGYFPSTTHRVMNPSGAEARNPRYSMPLFVHPRKEVMLSTLYTAGAYLKERLTQIGLIPQN